MNGEPYPIFVLGSGRCGSTLVQRLLNSCEDIAISGEHFGYLKGIADAYFTVSERLAQRGGTSESAFSDALAELKNPRVWSAWTNWLQLEQVTGTYRSFVRDMIAPGDGGAMMHWGFKEVRYGCGDRVVEMLLELLPDARFIVVVRHPINTIASMRQVNWLEGSSVDRLAGQWTCMYEYLYRLKSRYPENFLLVRYEDIVVDGYPGLVQMFAWLSHKVGDMQLKVLSESEARLPSPSRRNGVDPASLLTKHARREVYAATRGLRRVLNYEILEPLCIADGMILEDLGVEGVIRCHDGGSLELNDSGKLIVMLCDGINRVSDIVATLKREYPNAEPDEVEKSTIGFINDFFEKGVLLPG